MPGAERRGRSRGELIRQRTRARFVGRRAQLTQFAENLARDPESQEDPAEFLFHVRGVGGVGKSTLLREWQGAARRAGAVTAAVDENDVHGVQQALAELARQLAGQAGPLKEYDRAAEQYRREQETAAEPVPADGEASMTSRVAAQAALGAVSLIPGAGVVSAMANPDAAAQGLDRLRAGARARGRRARSGDAAGVSRAFVAELGRLCGRYRWVVLFLDTWEVTGRYLDGWLRDLLEDAFGPLPANVMVVLAGRDELPEREWAALRALVADVPLEVFTVAETRALLAARGVTEPGVVEAVSQSSMGLPLLVELLALTRPAAAEDVDAEGDAVDTAVERFVRWITDARQRETVLACALAPQLNEDIFAAAAPDRTRELWGWLCEQPFVSGRGDFKQYHAVVRASMVRQQRARSPRRWTEAHLRLADAHAAWRAELEQGLTEAKRWGDARWRRHRLDETYHRLCAQPAAYLPTALEQTVHAAGQETEILLQWTDAFAQAARDTADPALLGWSVRLRDAVADSAPALTALAVLLTHGRLDPAGRAWAHTYRGRHLYHDDRDEEALAELDRAVAADPGNARAWTHRGDVHHWLGHTEQAIADLTTALGIDPAHAPTLAVRGEALSTAGRHEEAFTDLATGLDLDPALARARAARGEVHRELGRYDEAVADFTAAAELDPALAGYALASRAQAHREAGRPDESVADFTAALGIDPAYAWARAQRGLSHAAAGRHDEAVADYTAALDTSPTMVWALAERGVAHREAGRPDEAVADLIAAAELDPPYAWALAQRGETHRMLRRFDEAVADFTAAVQINPAYHWALAHRGEAHREAGRFEEAVADFTAALALEPASTWTLASRGQAHRQAGRLEEAVTDLTAALDRDPELDWALAERGEAHRLAGRPDEAVADFTAALALEPASTWTLASRGQAHRQAGRFEEAVADLTAVLDRDPELAWALAERGEAHRLAGRPDEAVADLTAALALDPVYPWALARRGQAHRQAGRLDEAVADLTAALERDPDLAWVLAERGEAHRQTGRYEEAVADLTAALERDPDLAWVLAERGEAHRQAGRYEEAVADFTAALDRDPDLVWGLAHRGMALREAGHFARAREDLERAVASEPDDLGLLFEMAMLDTVVSGFAACRDQWAGLLARPVAAPPDEDATRFFALFRALLLDPEDTVEEAARAFLGSGPDADAVTDALHYLAELAAGESVAAERAGRCRRLVAAAARG
ncbi:tetratricopeptide repeat protein [Streptomyces leeuwenhoekii]|uniref:TPR repeat-containing protein slr0751 n=2 Tax=Streptomyces leeuwenhoekii TaxID=1437453 RepID=A0A0F7VW15_STRLW|nr:tetratricopeptide repeat protein [Streptomyces leeuwenhoekii]CQR64699.1 TPR repeat-containing protein slr0751 [Streptomyces leeuwenhoekii]